jgi:hypothetical protein
MKIVAFFNLQKKADINKFNDEVITEQVKIFKNKLPRMSNFQVFKLIDSDNFINLPQIIQIFDWEGTPEEWRKTLNSFQSTKDRDIKKITRDWLKFCENDSTQIIYAKEIKES